METSVTVIIFFVIAAHTGYCLKCYSCNISERECKDPFNRTLAATKLEKATRGYVCYKRVFEMDKKHFIGRGVVPQDEAEDLCKNHISGLCDICTAPDGCNSGNRYFGSFFSQLFQVMLSCISALIIVRP